MSPAWADALNAGKDSIDDCPVEQVISKKLNEMAEDIIWIKKGLTNKTPISRIISDSFFEFRSIYQLIQLI